MTLQPTPAIDQAIEQLRAQAMQAGGAGSELVLIICDELTRLQGQIKTLWDEVEEAMRSGLAQRVRMDQLTSELGRAREQVALGLEAMAKVVRERDTARTLLEAAELRCAKLAREVDRLSEEMRDTTIVAEAIITAPTPTDIRDAKLETALIDALEIAGRLARSGIISRRDAARLDELQRMVPS